jgi:hypothetical protein
MFVDVVDGTTVCHQRPLRVFFVGVYHMLFVDNALASPGEFIGSSETRSATGAGDRMQPSSRSPLVAVVTPPNSSPSLGREAPTLSWE